MGALLVGQDMILLPEDVQETYRDASNTVMETKPTTMSALNVMAYRNWLQGHVCLTH